MRKKTLAILLSLVTAVSVLSGCSLVTRNFEGDYMQVVAEITPITFTYSVLDEASGNYVSKTSQSKLTKIYKSDLVTQLNNNLSNYMQQNPDMELSEAINKQLDQLIANELVFIEADNLIEQGVIKLRMGDDGKYNDINEIRKQIYSAVDSELFTLTNTIRGKRGEQPLPQAEYSDPATPTFPLPPVDNGDEDEDFDELDLWQPSGAVIPRLDDGARLQAVRQLYKTIYDNVKDDPKATEQELKAFEDEKKGWDELAKTAAGTQQIYLDFGSSKILDYIIGKSVLKNIKLTKLQEVITEGVVISESDIQFAYNTTRGNQLESFANIDNYKSAIEGSDPVLYYPTTDYFFVRHILIPFTEEQQAIITSYRQNPNYEDEWVDRYRANLASTIVGYPHKNGENDLSRPMTPQQIYNEVAAQMNTLAGSAYNAERKFLDLTYLYNTDPGAFDSQRGYVIGPKPDKTKGETENWIEEFADAARELKAQYDKDGKLGTISGLVLGDYGYHIIYLADVPQAGEIKNLNDNVTPGRFDTYYDLFKEQLKSAKEAEFFNIWQEEKIGYYLLDRSNIINYEKRYKDLWKV